jgi:hypothetical protein
VTGEEHRAEAAHGNGAASKAIYKREPSDLLITALGSVHINEKPVCMCKCPPLLAYFLATARGGSSPKGHWEFLADD